MICKEFFWISQCFAFGTDSLRIFHFLRVSRPQRGRHTRKAEKEKGPQIPKILQEITVGVELRDLCWKKLNTQRLFKKYPDINTQVKLIKLCVATVPAYTHVYVHTYLKVSVYRSLTYIYMYIRI